MRRFSLAMLALAALSSSTIAVAQLAPTGQYSFSFTDASGSSGNGIFTVGAGGQVTLATGSVYDALAAGGPITTNILGVSGYAGADNLLYVNAPFVDFAGISLALADANNVNLFYSNGTYEAAIGNRDAFLTTNPCGCTAQVDYAATLDVGPVPEPATWAMMLVGFGAVGVQLRRRRPVTSFA